MYCRVSYCDVKHYVSFAFAKSYKRTSLVVESSVDIVDSQRSGANMKFWIASLLLLVAYAASAPVPEETTEGE